MVAYSFKRRFVTPIQAGLAISHPTYFGPVLPKRQTIRADRRRHARPGEEVQLYCGMRTRQCFLIGRARCIAAQPIEFRFARKEIWIDGPIPQHVRTTASLDEFARGDGFRDFDDMRSFFWATEHGAEFFNGVLIRWEPLDG